MSHHRILKPNRLLCSVGLFVVIPNLFLSSGWSTGSTTPSLPDGEEKIEVSTIPEERAVVKDSKIEWFEEVPHPPLSLI